MDDGWLVGGGRAEKAKGNMGARQRQEGGTWRAGTGAHLRLMLANSGMKDSLSKTRWLKGGHRAPRHRAYAKFRAELRAASEDVKNDQWRAWRKWRATGEQERHEEICLAYLYGKASMK